MGFFQSGVNYCNGCEGKRENSSIQVLFRNLKLLLVFNTSHVCGEDGLQRYGIKVWGGGIMSDSKSKILHMYI